MKGAAGQNADEKAAASNTTGKKALQSTLRQNMQISSRIRTIVRHTESPTMASKDTRCMREDFQSLLSNSVAGVVEEVFAKSVICCVVVATVVLVVERRSARQLSTSDCACSCEPPWSRMDWA